MRPRRWFIPVVLAVLTGATGVGADPLTVEATSVGGTRTLTIATLGGGDLQTISLGSSGEAAFATNVTDLRYGRSGYQVTAALSNLYAFDGEQFDCANRIDSANISLEFLLQPLSLSQVAALPAPLWELTGTLQPPLSTLLQVADGTAVAAADVAGEKVDRLLEGVLTGAEDALPIKVATGQAGPFTEPGPHQVCDPSPVSSTERSLQAGSANTLPDLFAWVTAEIEAAADVDPNGTITAAELVSAGEVTDAVMAEAVRQALGEAGVNLGLLDSLLQSGVLALEDVYAVLNATLDVVASLIGQSGIYISLPKLVVQIPGATPSGTYRGTLTVTMGDV